MDKLEQGYIDGFVKAANALSAGIVAGVKQPMESAESAIARLQSQKTKDFVMPNRKNLLGQPLSGGPGLNAPNGIKDKLHSLWNDPKSNTIGDMSLRKATGLGAGLGAGTIAASQGAGALTSGMGGHPSDLAQRTQEATQGPSIDPSGLYEMLKQHLSKHEVGYGVGGAALGLGGLGYYLSKHKNKKKIDEGQIPFSSGEDEPGVETNE
jgi:hypothetical protein